MAVGERGVDGCDGVRSLRREEKQKPGDRGDWDWA